MTDPLLEINAASVRLAQALLAVDRLAVQEILTRPYADLSSYQVVEALVIPALETIGSGWDAGTFSLSQVYMSGRLCEEIVDQLLPPGDPARLNQPKMAIAVLEDYHVLGMRIVYSVLRASGIELLNYGRMDAETLARRAVEDRLDILFISVLMLPSALKVRDLRARLAALGVQIKVVVGGAPFRFDPLLWREVGADAYGTSAIEAVDIVHRMIGEIS